MAVFTLVWDNTVVLANANAIAQRASHRRKDVGGTWFTIGYAPTNDMDKSVSLATSPDLLPNVIYEFRVQAICTTGGPTSNANGIQEQIIFECINPTINHTDVASTISLDVTGLNLTKARFTLRKTSDNTIVSGPITVAVSVNTITTTTTGLTASTNYYWQVELLTTIMGVEVISSSISYLDSVCTPYSFTTSVPATCPAPSDLKVYAVLP